MKDEEHWRPGKFVRRGGRWRASRDPKVVLTSSRLVGDIAARSYSEVLARHARGRLLDLGCGTVPMFGMYRPRVDEVVCSDWGGSLHELRHVDVVADLSEPLPFEDAEFDTVLLSDVLEHVPDPRLLWGELARILAPGGRCIVGVPFLYPIHEAPHDHHRFTRFELEAAARRVGLELVELRAVGGAPEVLGDLVAKSAAQVPWLGGLVSRLSQWSIGLFIRTSLGRRISERTAESHPLGYLLVARRPGAESVTGESDSAGL